MEESPYKIIILPKAEREIKRLAKKYRTFGRDLADLFALFQETPIPGESLGKDCYKIRLAISDKRQGKSGGARVITQVRIVHETIVVLSVYDKGEIATISDDELDSRLSELDDMN
jgi:mRNA-degrading endonuclease RelE of RelBE toxin-antitoxin system